jgi:hypothetical protein
MEALPHNDSIVIMRLRWYAGSYGSADRPISIAW